MNRRNNLKHQRGDANLIVIAVGLPLILLFFAIVFDYYRIPILTQTIEAALQRALSNTVQLWDCDGDTNCPVLEQSESISEIGFGIESFPPTAFNLCRDHCLVGLDGIKTSILPGANYFSNENYTSRYARAIVANMVLELKSINGIYNIDVSQNLAIEVGVYSIETDPQTGVQESTVPPFKLGEYIYGDFDGLSALSPFQTKHAVDTLQRHLDEIKSPAWKIICAANNLGSFNSEETSCSKSPYLENSVWLTAVVYLKLESFFGVFSLLGTNIPESAKPDADGEFMIVVEQIQPMNMVAALQG